MQDLHKGCVQVIDEEISGLPLGFTHRLRLYLRLVSIERRMANLADWDCNVDGSIIE